MRLSEKDRLWDTWHSERNRALESLDIKVYRRFYEKWYKAGVYESPLPPDNVAEVNMLYQATRTQSLPADTRRRAKELWERKRPKKKD